MQLKLVTSVPTSLNALYINKFSFNPKTRKSEPTGARILSKAGMTSKKLIQKAVKKQMIGQDWSYDFTKENYIYIDLVFYFGRVGRDSDNCLKLMQDSLQGIVFDNDNKVLCRVQKVLFDANNPRVEMHIHPVDYRGIFNDQSQLDQFESGCSTCSRYGNNCSILVKAKEGRIQSEIEDMKCSKYKQIADKKKSSKSK